MAVNQRRKIGWRKCMGSSIKIVTALTYTLCICEIAAADKVLRCCGDLSLLTRDDCERLGTSSPGCYFEAGFYEPCNGRCDSKSIGSIEEGRCRGFCGEYARSSCKAVDRGVTCTPPVQLTTTQRTPTTFLTTQDFKTTLLVSITTLTPRRMSTVTSPTPNSMSAVTSLTSTCKPPDADDTEKSQETIIAASVSSGIAVFLAIFVVVLDLRRHSKCQRCLFCAGPGKCILRKVFCGARCSCRTRKGEANLNQHNANDQSQNWSVLQNGQIGPSHNFTAVVNSEDAEMANMRNTVVEVQDRIMRPGLTSERAATEENSGASGESVPEAETRNDTDEPF